MSKDTIEKTHELHPENNDFIAYPLHNVVSVFDDPAKVDEALAELKSHGFKLDDIEAFCGDEGKKRMDFEGKGHGALTEVIRAIQHLGPDREQFEYYKRHLDAGHCMIMVKVNSEGRRKSAAEILHNYTDERVRYFGLLATSEV